MKITARISFEEPDNRELVIKAFFSKEEFSKNNSIKIEDDKIANIELVFSDIPPQSIINAISICKVESLEYKDDNAMQIFENSNKVDDNHDSEEDSTTSTIKTVNADFDNDNEKVKEASPPDSTRKDTSKKSNDAGVSKRKKRRGRAKPSEDDYLDIPELDEFARESASFEEFLTKVAKWIETEPDIEKYFCALLTELKKLEQKPFELRMIQIEDITKKVTKKPFKKTKLSRHLTDFLAKKEIEGGTFTPFIITVLKYKDSFSNKEGTEDVAEVSGAEEIDKNESENMADVPVTEEVESSKGDFESDSTETHRPITPPPLRSFEERYAKQSAVEEIMQNSNAPVEDDDAMSEGVKEPNNSDTSKKEGKAAETTNTSQDGNNLINNPAFAEILSKVDKSLSREEQIAELYIKMGFKKPSISLYNKLCELTMTALSMEHLDSIDDVMLKAGVDASTTDGLRAKVKISDMINEYNKANHIKRMKVIAFLREIKSIFSLE